VGNGIFLRPITLQGRIQEFRKGGGVQSPVLPSLPFTSPPSRLLLPLLTLRRGATTAEKLRGQGLGPNTGALAPRKRPGVAPRLACVLGAV